MAGGRQPGTLITLPLALRFTAPRENSGLSESAFDVCHRDILAGADAAVMDRVRAVAMGILAE